MNDIMEELVKRMKQGDEAAFNHLYELYVKKLYGMAFLISGNRADSEDIVQETFVKCFLNRASIREEAAFESWLYQILVRTAWRYMKKKKPAFSYEELTDVSDGAYSGEWARKDTEASEPLEEVLRREEMREILQAMAKLDLKQRTVLTLYYVNELPVREIARVTGVLEGTVKSRLHKGRENLRKSLKKGREVCEGRHQYGTV